LLVFAGFLKEEYASRCPSSVITSATMTASGHGQLRYCTPNAQHT